MRICSPGRPASPPHNPSGPEVLLGKQGDLNFFLKEIVALDPVAPVPRALASRISTLAKTNQANGKARFENLGIGDRGVGHVDLYGGGSFPTDGRSGSAPDGFVMTEGGIPEGQVVHCPLRTSHPAESAKDKVDDALTDFGVPTRNCGALIGIVGKGGMKEGAFGNDQVSGFKQSFVERQILADEEAQSIADRTGDDGLGGVEVVRPCGSGP